MSRITEKPAVGGLTPWASPNTATSNYSGTATPPSGSQAFAAVPATGAQPSSGTGFYDPSFCTYIGQKFETSDGRELALVQVGATAIGAGKLVQAPAEVTAFEKLAMTVPTAYPATAGTTQILVTNGATVLNVNQFQGGYLIVETGTGAGQILKIGSHQPAAASATFVVTVEDPIQTTLDATSKVNLIYNPYGSTGAGIVVSNHSTLGVPVGVTLYALSASTAGTYSATTGAQTANGTAQYGLIVTHGPTACLIDTLTNVGYPVGPSTNTDGAVNVATLTSSPQVGVSGQTQTSTHYGLIYVQL